MGDEETNATVLVGEALLSYPEPPAGVLSGDRRQDFVGDENPCIGAGARCTVSIHFVVRLFIV
jgi:hypothetical protein